MMYVMSSALRSLTPLAATARYGLQALVACALAFAATSALAADVAEVAAPAAPVVLAQQAVEEETAPAPRRSLFGRPGRRRDRRQATEPAQAESTSAAESQAPVVSRQARREERRQKAIRKRHQVPLYEQVPIPDRWRIVEALGVNERWYDPYNQNTLKADRPIFGTQDWFFNLNVINDLSIEPRGLPIPVGLQANADPGSLDIFGNQKQLGVVNSLIVSTALLKGDTTFRPPDYEFRVTGVLNGNFQKVETAGALFADPAKGTTRADVHFALQDAFIDYHLRNKSDRYDFDSIRVGIQPFTSDFRGFLFQDNQLGARLFGNFANNRLQYNVAYFRRLEKDTNSGLNDYDLRRDDIFTANLYYQDFPVLGFQVQGSVTYNRNREDRDEFFNENGFLQRPAPVGDGRPHNYDVVYVGFSGDGHIDRVNLTFSTYGAFGTDDHNPIAGRKTDIRAYFVAAEFSYDRDWYRLKAYGLWSSGDEDPQDGKAGGFDAIFENPQFAGADTAFWQRQSIPLIFGGGVVLSGRNSIIPSLRTSKEQGQSNFVNPGIGMVGIGADLDILPELRLETNVAWLTFDDTSSLRFLRNQAAVHHEIGWDLSAALIYRPFFSQNIILRLAGAVLLPGKGMDDLFLTSGDSNPFYSILTNLILTY